MSLNYPIINCLNMFGIATQWIYIQATENAVGQYFMNWQSITNLLSRNKVDYKLIWSILIKTEPIETFIYTDSCIPLYGRNI